MADEEENRAVGGEVLGRAVDEPSPRVDFLDVGGLEPHGLRALRVLAGDPRRCGILGDHAVEDGEGGEIREVGVAPPPVPVADAEEKGRVF